LESLFIGTPYTVVLTEEYVILYRFGMTVSSSVVGMFVDC